MDHGQGDYAAVERALTGGARHLAAAGRTASRRPYELFLLGRSALWRGDRAAAQALFLESLDLRGQAATAAMVGSPPRLWLAEAAFDDGDDDAARAWAEQALARPTRCGLAPQCLLGAAAAGRRRGAPG